MGMLRWLQQGGPLGDHKGSGTLKILAKSLRGDRTVACSKFFVFLMEARREVGGGDNYSHGDCDVAAKSLIFNLLVLVRHRSIDVFAAKMNGIVLVNMRLTQISARIGEVNGD